LNFAGKPTEIVTVEYLTKHMAYVFHKFHICFLLFVLKRHTAHTCGRGGIKTLKAQGEDHLQLVYHGCKNLTHTSKTCQVKCTQVVVIVRDHDSRVYYFFRLQTIERNEAVARKDVRFKSEPSPESLQLGGFAFAQGDLMF